MARSLALIIALAGALATWYAIHYGISRVPNTEIATVLFWLSPWTFVGWAFVIGLVVGFYKLAMLLLNRRRPPTKVSS